MATAIVTGATGITGNAIVHELVNDSRFRKIYTLSRSQQGKPHENIVHATLDLQSSAEEMAKQLKGVTADYIFFCAYLAKDDEAEAARVNNALLKNFLDALAINGDDKQLKRILLTAGLKQYGVHQGQPKNPMHETDPWLDQSDRPPNFYYEQQKTLITAAKGQQWEWVVTYPQDVIGVAKANFMNLPTALGLYCAVSKLLPGSELPFPGSKINYLAMNCWTSAKTNAKFCLWAAFADGAGNNGFNVVNGDTESWQNLWPKLAKRFGCKIPDKMFPGGGEGEYKDFESITIELPYRPPIDEFATEMGMTGEFKKSRVHQQIDTAAWSKRPEVIEAYNILQDKYSLDPQGWKSATWSFLTFLLGREFSCVVSMSKARKLGWTGYQDTWEAFEETFQELEAEGILPEINTFKKEPA